MRELTRSFAYLGNLISVANYIYLFWLPKSNDLEFLNLFLKGTFDKSLILKWSCTYYRQMTNFPFLLVMQLKLATLIAISLKLSTYIILLKILYNFTCDFILAPAVIGRFLVVFSANFSGNNFRMNFDPELCISSIKSS